MENSPDNSKYFKIKQFDNYIKINYDKLADSYMLKPQVEIVPGRGDTKDDILSKLMGETIFFIELGNKQFEKEEYSIAKKFFKLALIRIENYKIIYEEEVDTPEKYCYDKLSVIYCRLGEYKEVIELLNKYDIYNSESKRYEYIGDCYEKMNDFLNAKLNYKKAYEEDENNFLILNKIAILCYRKMDNIYEAEDILRNGIERFPDCALFYNNLAIILHIKTNDYEEPKRLLSIAFQKDSNLIEANITQEAYINKQLNPEVQVIHNINRRQLYFNEELQNLLDNDT